MREYILTGYGLHSKYDDWRGSAHFRIPPALMPRDGQMTGLDLHLSLDIHRQESHNDLATGPVEIALVVDRGILFILCHAGAHLPWFDAPYCYWMKAPTSRYAVSGDIDRPSIRICLTSPGSWRVWESSPYTARHIALPSGFSNVLAEAMREQARTAVSEWNWMASAREKRYQPRPWIKPEDTGEWEFADWAKCTGTTQFKEHMVALHRRYPSAEALLSRCVARFGV